jgi:hypothetical protein
MCSERGDDSAPHRVLADAYASLTRPATA